MRRLIGSVISNNEIDRVLSREDEILPWAGFAVSVREAVRREAAAPRSILFPWKRALPGLVVGGLVLAVVLVAGVVAIAQMDKATAPPPSISLPSGLARIFQGNVQSAPNWTMRALLVTFLSVKLLMLLASGASCNLGVER